MCTLKAVRINTQTMKFFWQKHYRPAYDTHSRIETHTQHTRTRAHAERRTDRQRDRQRSDSRWADSIRLGQRGKRILRDEMYRISDQFHLEGKNSSAICSLERFLEKKA